MFTKDYINFILSLIDKIQRSSKRANLFRWCEQQKQYWKEEYAKLK